MKLQALMPELGSLHFKCADHLILEFRLVTLGLDSGALGSFYGPLGDYIGCIQQLC